MEQQTIIKVRDLSKKFGSFEAVKDVSFTVHKGDVFGFLGPNGAGKSTTIRCLLSLISPDNGTIELFGKSLHKNRSEILANIGSIIEKPDFYKYLSAQKNLEIFARISGANVSKKEILKMLDFVGLGNRAKHKVKGFSHGMKQRLGIAQTLLHQPELIILDEPTTGLDPQGIIEIRNLILRLKNEQNKTILLSSHQLSEIELIANRMVIINQGKSIVEGSVEELLNSEETIVRVEIDGIEPAMDLIRSKFNPKELTQTSSKEAEVLLSKSRVPDLTKELVLAGFTIHAIEPKRKLEDYFIKTIQS
ncbi:ABC transporter ATP-binding protein [Fluviicola chungangensis]|uniref:ABC transporter ATP-binding protein n=1 Tax=Fluviicola chungangensis TaxID=2597671 RepID=A0A556MMK3_9FLAO|nr:ABC transporter ATP-binding protein [Fluviicola chungangensis]TSJ41174.1 ABC transporter ATP-binding protein [Fluviicola chungangensis]